jgi:hypothetical protein
MLKTGDLKYNIKGIKSVFVVREKCKKRGHADARSVIMFLNEKDFY